MNTIQNKELIKGDRNGSSPKKVSSELDLEELIGIVRLKGKQIILGEMMKTTG